MTFAMFAGIVAGTLSLLAYIPRAIKIIRDKSHSSNLWLIWTLSNLLIAMSYYNLGARTTIWVPLAYLIGSAGITILTFIYKARGWSILDKWLLTVVILCMMRWWFFSNPIIDLSFNVFIYLIGYVIIIQAKLKSQKRGAWIVTWALFFSGSIINLLAINQWSIETVAYPMILCLMNGTVFLITFKNYIFQKDAHEEPEEETSP